MFFRLAGQETLPIWVQQVLESFCLLVTSVDITRVQYQWIFTCAVLQVSQNQLVPMSECLVFWGF